MAHIEASNTMLNHNYYDAQRHPYPEEMALNRSGKLGIRTFTEDSIADNQAALKVLPTTPGITLS